MAADDESMTSSENNSDILREAVGHGLGALKLIRETKRLRAADTDLSPQGERESARHCAGAITEGSGPDLTIVSYDRMVLN